jgi:hypothetical protein
MSPGRISTLAEMSPRITRSFKRTAYDLPPSEPREIVALSQRCEQVGHALAFALGMIEIDNDSIVVVAVRHG